MRLERNHKWGDLIKSKLRKIAKRVGVGYAVNIVNRWVRAINGAYRNIGCGVKLKSGSLEAQQYYNTVEGLYKVKRIKGLKDRICLDLGAHVGIFSLRVAKLTGCIVHAYEPHPKNYEDLLYHIKVNGFQNRIIPFNEAVWDSDGEAELSLDPFAGSSDSHSLCNMGRWDKIKVKTVSPEKVFKRISGPIGYLKVNCQGGEYYVLKYLMQHQEILERTERMCIEIHPDMLGEERMKEITEMIVYIKSNYDIRVRPRLKVMFASVFVKGLDPKVIAALEVDTL